jgi:hypothetical protein
LRKLRGEKRQAAPIFHLERSFPSYPKNDG